jgi:hypothetical protein
MHTDDRELRRRKDAARGVAAAEALENSLSSAVPTLPVRAIAQLSSEPKAGGPGVLLPEIFAVVLGDDPIGRIADYIALGVALRAGLNWLKAHGGKEITVDGGNAFLLASTAIHEAGGPNDLKLQFVQEIHSVAYDWAEWESELQGFLVGFRDNGTLYQVAVALDGTVGTVTQVPIEVLRSSEPDDFDNV